MSVWTNVVETHRRIGGDYLIVERDGYVIIHYKFSTIAILDYDLCQWWATDGTQFIIAERNQMTPSVVNLHRIDTASQVYAEDQVGVSRPQIDAYLQTHVAGASPRSMPISGIPAAYVHLGLGACVLIPIAVAVGTLLFCGWRKRALAR
ncbi:MAG: hypothetical protein NCW75_10545 [Phycisphaera sp.]|nr:MAG: hypothetical protein NCW75_10545 [Phycisphaera sp.]